MIWNEDVNDIDDEDENDEVYSDFEVGFQVFCFKLFILVFYI